MKAEEEEWRREQRNICSALGTAQCSRAAAVRVRANLFHVLCPLTLKNTGQADPSYYTKQLPGDYGQIRSTSAKGLWALSVLEHKQTKHRISDGSQCTEKYGL